MPMFEGELQALGTALMDVTMNGRDRTRSANRHEWYAPHGVYPCAGDDEWVAIAVTSDAQWQGLCQILGKDDLASDERYLRQADRYTRQDELDAIIAEWTAARSHCEAQDALQSAGISAGAVLRVGELSSDPQARHRSSLDWAEQLETAASLHTRVAWLSQGGNGGMASPGPAFGGGNDYVFRDLLRLTDADIDSLVRDKITAYVPIGYSG
jgi:benzylsuccinate CoA-transferase BbsF subunit